MCSLWEIPEQARLTLPLHSAWLLAKKDTESVSFPQLSDTPQCCTRTVPSSSTLCPNQKKHYASPVWNAAANISSHGHLWPHALSQDLPVPVDRAINLASSNSARCRPAVGCFRTVPIPICVKRNGNEQVTTSGFPVPTGTGKLSDLVLALMRHSYERVQSSIARYSAKTPKA